MKLRAFFSHEFFASIRFKIFFLYVLVLFLALMFFNVLIYLNHKDTLERKIDALLGAKIEAVESAVHTYRQTQPAEGNWFSELFGREQKRPEDPYDIIVRYLTEDTQSSSASDPRIYVDIFDGAGRPLDSTHPENNTKSLDKALLRRVLAAKKYSYTLTTTEKSGRRIPVRALAKALTADNQVREIVQARVNTRPMQHELNDLMLKLFTRSLIVILLASSGSFFLVKSTLKPVDQMTRIIRNIKLDNLHQRLEAPETLDEIARLATTFNTMLERLEGSFKSQRQIVQDISHELKTPMTIISGQIEVSLKKRRSPDEYEDTLRSTLEEALKVKRVIDNLLLFAKFDSPGHSLEMKSLDLDPLLEGVVQDTRIQGLERELDVSYEAHGPAQVYGNEVHLERLFRNLLENAVKYNKPGGSIRVAVRNNDNTLEVTVKDTGVGIASENVDKIFDRFYRVDPARSSGEGFGLGLSISKSIVDAHGGGIGVKSVLGEGSEFNVCLSKSAIGYFLAP